MGYYRNVLLTLDSEKNCELLNEIPKWEYCDQFDSRFDSSFHAAGFVFTLINKTENLQIFFRKIKDCIYISTDVLPYNTSLLTDICEPQEKYIQKDILFKLCKEINKKFVNWEIICSIIPCENDEF